MKKSMKIKLKAMGFLAAAALLTLGLASCGKSNQDVFSENLQQLGDQKEYNAADFSLKFDKVDIDYETGDTSTDAITSMVGTQLEDAKLSGSYILDTKSNAMDYKMKVEAMGQEVPLDFQIADDGLYYSCDSFTKIVDIAQSFSGEKTVDLSSIGDQLKGKYLKLEEKDMQGYAVDFSSLTKQKSDTLLPEFIKTLDKDSFKKDGDVYSHTFNKKEIVALIKFAKEKGDKDTKKAFKDVNVSDIEDTKELEKLDLTVSINAKTKKIDYKVDTAYSDDKGSVDLAMTFTVKMKKAKDGVETPAADKTVSLDELESMVSDGAKMVVSDEDFESLYSDLESLAGYYTKDEVASMLASYSFTPEQQAKIDALFDK